jgi:oligoendopeptidase F
MGLDPEAAGRIIYDTAEREGKRSRAFCAPVRIPDEVYLVLRPHGGATDWQTLLHEVGHALHFGNMSAALPFEHRWLGDNSVTEGYAMLFDHRMQDAGWLRRYSGLRGADLARFLRRAAFGELRFIRRYCAKLLYELDLHGGELSPSQIAARYAERLTDATGFRYSADDAYGDVDPRFYVGRYLQAWQLQAILAAELTEHFNEDWWRNPSAGPWLRDVLFAEGQRETAGELAKRVAGRELSFTPLIAEIERLLES